ncbi:hypothetical protein AB7C87_09980 [Natrarchaeobius sp. A-rgal3]|uniref:hypothetical protein n=1 Tax=Natrarchaeobius versutus TaxID=1679078 RepID=UPI00350E91F0
MENESKSSGDTRAAAFFLILGIVLFGYGVGQLTDVITYDPPAAVYLLIAMGLFAAAIVQIIRS